ncbi:conserved hypothetical protein [Desulfatibacillum aliphaticivorans]|uniref:Helicase HerA central domain-containing protein n=1 Tax=Desulfatibacillum aliphaticivorans TaxID=218208 RepID=B8FH20_DESAL|nr:DUF87 domain-containing protein [Desulfatibacillum aliphaticivorans]ACL02108.1 conserved hypothetical protein [Desulfatibacillum aliphaticivorans]
MNNKASNFFNKAEHQDNPLRALVDFLKAEESNESAQNYDKMRFVGYVLDIGFDQATIITCDPFKQAVGGVPRGSFLIMAPANFNGMPPHFSLLRVSATAPTPLSREVQQTYFELHKKSMPELDVWTKGELQWGALSTKVLGMFFPDKDDSDKVQFSGDVNNVVSAHRYKVFSPNMEILDIIINSMVRPENRFPIGNLRVTECSLPFANITQPDLEVNVSTDDFKGFRTAMFGKTRLGKSNVVKIIAQSLIETTEDDKSVGQLIFDINGEYANDNPQDNNMSLRSANKERCCVYALTKRPDTDSQPLRLNFYEQPDSTISILKSMLERDNRGSMYITNFANVELPGINNISSMSDDISKQRRSIRKIQMYWAILHKAGYPANENKLKKIGLKGSGYHSPNNFDPAYNKDFRQAVFNEDFRPNNLNELVNYFETIERFRVDDPNNAIFTSSSGKPVFDADDLFLLGFLVPKQGSGASVISAYREFHDPLADNFAKSILKHLDNGSTVILDLGNAADVIRQYFSDLLSKEVFRHQEQKFTANKLGNHYIQLYFEEAHNLFPRDNKDLTGVYSRFAKEGAKFHIGMVYSTQSPSTISKELLAQTENFFVAHMSSQDEANALAKLQVQYDGLQHDILHTRTPGYMRILTFSHRFVVPVQINKFEAVNKP